MRKFVELRERKENKFLNGKTIVVMIIVSAMISILLPMAINIQDKSKRKEVMLAASNKALVEKVVNLESWEKSVQEEIVQLKKNQNELYEKYNLGLKGKERNELMKVNNEIEYNNMKLKVLEYRLNNKVMENETGWENKALHNIMELAKENTAVIANIEEFGTRKNLEKEYNEYKKNFIAEKQDRAKEIKSNWYKLENGIPQVRVEEGITKLTLNSDNSFKIIIMILGIIMTSIIITDVTKKVIAKKYY